MKGRSIYYVGAALCALGFHMTAYGQTSPSANEPQAHGNFEDIIVTARRRVENLQDVPVAITAVSGAALEQRGVRAVEDLRASTPSLNVTSTRRDEAAFYLRGQGPGNINVGQRNFTSVATYFAEVPTEITGPGVFFDLASVQILKGPQGTLFGRNTTGGAVLFEPNRPGFELEGYVKGSIGNYAYRELEGALSIPVLPDVLAVRVAGNIAKRDGFTRSVITNQRLDGRNYHAYRVSVLFTPSSEIENLTIIDGRDKDQSGSGQILRQINPSSALYASLLPFLQRQQQLGARETLIPERIYDRQHAIGITNRTTWEVSDNITLKNIVSSRKSRTDRAFDYDGTPFPTLYVLNAPPPRKWQYGLEQFTEEFQLQGRLPHWDASYILGFYYEKAKPGFPQEVRQSVFGNVAVRNLSTDDTSKAVFAHVEANLTDRLQVSGGFRYTWDNREATASVRNVAGACTQQVPPGSGIFQCPDIATVKSDAPSYDATIQYKFADQALIYASYKHGYKSGGANLPSPAPEFSSFGPETVDEFEVGMKADWDIGIPFRMNLAAFIDKYKDIQVAQPVNIPGVGILSLTTNAARATNKGVELDMTVVPFEGFTLGGFGSYLDAHSDVTVPGTASVKGRQAAFTPKWKFGVNGSLDLPVGEELGVLRISANYSWQSRANTSDVRAAIDTTYPAYGLLNARVELMDIGDTGVDFSLFATNLTNKTYILGGLPLADAIGFESAVYGEPRMYGMSLRFNFGR